MKALPFELKLGYILAIVLMVTLVLFLIFIVILYNRRQVILQNEKKLKETEYQNILLQKELEYQKNTVKERERISHDMHDDFGSVISAIKLQVEFLKQKIPNKGIDQNFTELLETCDELNVSMREMLWSLNSANDSLQSLVDYIMNYAENFFDKTNINVHIYTDNIQDTQISADIRRNLFLCIKEVLNNVYKHSQAENVSLYFANTKNEFSIDVVDDGIGIKNKNTSGNGLGNMHCRMSSVDGNFRIVPSEKGVHVNFTLQL